MGSWQPRPCRPTASDSPGAPLPDFLAFLVCSRCAQQPSLPAGPQFACILICPYSCFPPAVMGELTSPYQPWTGLARPFPSPCLCQAQLGTPQHTSAETVKRHGPRHGSGGPGAAFGHCCCAGDCRWGAASLGRPPLLLPAGGGAEAAGAAAAVGGPWRPLQPRNGRCRHDLCRREQEASWGRAGGAAVEPRAAGQHGSLSHPLCVTSSSCPLLIHAPAGTAAAPTEPILVVPPAAELVGRKLQQVGGFGGSLPPTLVASFVSQPAPAALAEVSSPSAASWA